MTENTKELKTITATEMLTLTGGASHQKIMENNHKENILKMDIERMFRRLKEELAEFNQAFRIWQSNPTEKNKKNMLMEWADCNNFGSSMIAKADGYQRLVRE